MLRDDSSLLLDYLPKGTHSLSRPGTSLSHSWGDADRRAEAPPSGPSTLHSEPGMPALVNGQTEPRTALPPQPRSMPLDTWSPGLGSEASSGVGPSWRLGGSLWGPQACPGCLGPSSSTLCGQCPSPGPMGSPRAPTALP
ncbi:uncharacterized protein LOC114203659 [Eumetopias jubatus]|nr:uncharacterized protein LOC114203658 [Eumetopias jubatus]XP_027952798.1 uncharacterized protein LOC114203659 [Eumetopias jubatus]